mmetsp:Transcript_17276/g.38033  ORF Transcript_17276/g.38033 Transcript_17276/m.38033 type:complete len:219 (+) Transcript_17276:16-672(+)
MIKGTVPTHRSQKPSIHAWHLTLPVAGLVQLSLELAQAGRRVQIRVPLRMFIDTCVLCPDQVLVAFLVRQGCVALLILRRRRGRGGGHRGRGRRRRLRRRRRRRRRCRPRRRRRRWCGRGCRRGLALHLVLSHRVLLHACGAARHGAVVVAPVEQHGLDLVEARVLLQARVPVGMFLDSSMHGPHRGDITRLATASGVATLVAALALTIRCVGSHDRH